MWKGLANSSERKSESWARLICDAAAAILQDEAVKQQIRSVPRVPMFWLPTNYHRTNLCQHVWTLIQLLLLVAGSLLFSTPQIEAKNKSTTAERLNNMKSTQDNYKNRRWWFSLLGVWIHKTHLPLTQKSGVYDSLQCLSANAGLYFLKWRLLPQSSSEQFLSGQGCFAAPWSKGSLTRRKFLFQTQNLDAEEHWGAFHSFVQLNGTILSSEGGDSFKGVGGGWCPTLWWGTGAVLSSVDPVL